MNSPRLLSNPADGLIEDALGFHQLTQAQASRDMKIPRSRLTDIFAGRKSVSADTAPRVERYLGIPASLLLRLQTDFDLSQAIEKKVKMVTLAVNPLGKKLSYVRLSRRLRRSIA
jgi:addiction module HigA family antidote